jgi:hypothetical protein
MCWGVVRSHVNAPVDEVQFSRDKQFVSVKLTMVLPAASGFGHAAKKKKNVTGQPNIAVESLTNA